MTKLSNKLLYFRLREYIKRKYSEEKALSFTLPQEYHWRQPQYAKATLHPICKKVPQKTTQILDPWECGINVGIQLSPRKTSDNLKENELSNPWDFVTCIYTQLINKGSLTFLPSFQLTNEDLPHWENSGPLCHPPRLHAPRPLSACSLFQPTNKFTDAFRTKQWDTLQILLNLLSDSMVQLQVFLLNAIPSFPLSMNNHQKTGHLFPFKNTTCN